MGNNTASNVQEVTTNFIEAAIAAYLGSNVKVYYTSMTTKKPEFLERKLDVFQLYFYAGKQECTCKLQLRSLADITLEHLTKLAVMAMQSKYITEVIPAYRIQVGDVSKDREKTFVQVFCKDIEHYLYIFNDFRLVLHCAETTAEVPIENQVEIIDFLREESYAIPFRGVDLVKAGIAEYIREDKFIEKPEALKKYKVFIEGYAVTGGSANARQMIGPGDQYEWEGETFEDACRNAVIGCEMSMENYDAKRNTYWGCRFFDNYMDARKSFG